MGVVEPLPEHVLEVPLGPEAELAPARAADHVGRLAHRFRSPRERGVGRAEEDLLRGLGDRLEAGGAEAVDRHCGSGLGRAGLERDVAGQVHRVRRGLERVAVYDVPDRFGFDAGSLERGPRRERRELGRGERPEASAEAAEGRPLRRKKNDLFRSPPDGSGHAPSLRSVGIAHPDLAGRPPAVPLDPEGVDPRRCAVKGQHEAGSLDEERRSPVLSCPTEETQGGRIERSLVEADQMHAVIERHELHDPTGRDLGSAG